MTIDFDELGRRAKTASRALAIAPMAVRDSALAAIADALEADADAVLAANGLDVDAGRARGLSDALLDRLSLAGGRLAGVIRDVRAVVALADPVGETIETKTMESGLRVERRRVPIGVLGVIYEARPNVTVDIASLAIKTGNVSVLRGGSETLSTNRALVSAIRRGLETAGLPPDCVLFLDSADRSVVGEMVRQHRFIDMLIPRGGAALHEFCRREGTIPVIIGGIGVCHLFVDETADLARALPVLVNAKTSRPSVCNSLDTVVVHHTIAADFLPGLRDAMLGSGVALRVDARAAAFLPPDGDRVRAAGPDDFDTEWMSLTLGVTVADDIDDAIAFVQAHSSGHSDGILTESRGNAARFVAEIDSSAVMVNASTRFNDGGQFGLGAEVAVSTQKLHARGPMGLEALTTYKWIATGDYLSRG